MENEIIEFFNFVAPLIVFLGFIIWAELARNLLIYLIGVVVGIALVVEGEFSELRFAIVAVIMVLIVRAGFLISEKKTGVIE